MKKLFLLIPVFVLNSLFLISCGNTLITPKDFTIQISDSAIISAYVTDYYPNNNFRYDNDFAAVAWRADSTPYIGRTLFKFNLTVIPRSAVIKSAQLLLNYDQTPFHYSGAGHHQDSGSNASYMQRITQYWADTNVNWINQPATTSVNQIVLDSSTSGFQNYSVDMTSAISDMVSNPNNNFGFLFRLKTESPLRVLGFTRGIGNPTIKPVLVVKYSSTQ